MTTLAQAVQSTVTPINKSSFTITKLLNGDAGFALQAIALQSMNFITSSQIANHPSLKMPEQPKENATPDALRDLIYTNPEFKPADRVALDRLVDANIATCALIRDLAEHTEPDASGNIVYPYAWIAERARTPQSSVTSQYDWRADQSAKVAGAQARLMKLSNPEAIEAKFKANTIAQNAERMAYALAEVTSVTRPSLLKAETNELVDLITNLDGVAFDIMKVIRASAERDVERARTRLEAGLFARVDEEVILFVDMA